MDVFCSRCGSVVADDAVFCAKCGFALQQPPYPQQPQKTASPYQPPYRQPNFSSVEPDLPMNWYKFLVNFALIAGAILNGITGVLAITGAQYSAYGAEPSVVYGKIDGLQALDIVYGIMLLGLAFFSFTTRQALAKYQAVGPKCLLVVYIANAVVALIYTSAISTLYERMNIPYDGASSIVSSIVGCIVMVIVNCIYFKKRAHLFTD